MTMNTNRMIELALVFFVSLLSFSIGTYVGKKYSDNQHRLAQLEPQNKDVAHSDVVDHGTDVDAHETAAAAHETKTAMTDSDVAQLAKEFATEDETAVDSKNVTEVAAENEHGAKSETHTVAAKPKTTTTHAIEKIKEATKDIHTTDLKREVASISEKAKTLGAAMYTVQVGAYPTSVDAEKMIDSLKARGYQASAVSANVNGKTWYRVQVGLFDNVQAAQDYKKDLMEKNKLASAIIQKVQK
jgi:DedD protein